MDDDHCVRILNEDGEHVMSLLLCDDKRVYDLADPDGKVLYCGIDQDLADVFIERMIVAPLTPVKGV